MFEVVVVVVVAVDHSLMGYDDLFTACCVHLQGDRRRLLEDRGM
jgi:hypothetical protein